MWHQSNPEPKYAPMFAVGMKGRIFEKAFCGTYKHVPGLQLNVFGQIARGEQFLDIESFASYIAIRDAGRNNTTCECLALSLKPPAIATASVTVSGHCGGRTCLA
jgi:hypothetical protein